MKNTLSRWARRVGETTRKAEDLSRNTWQHREYRFVFPRRQWTKFVIVVID